MSVLTSCSLCFEEPCAVFSPTDQLVEHDNTAFRIRIVKSTAYISVHFSPTICQAIILPFLAAFFVFEKGVSELTRDLSHSKFAPEKDILMSTANSKTNNGHTRNGIGPRFTEDQLQRVDRLELTDSSIETESTRLDSSHSDSSQMEFASSTAKQPATETVRTIQPCGVVVLGGSGGKVLERLKKLLERQKTHKFVTYRYFDTDPSAQTNSGLTDKQFCLVRTGATANALQNPEGHEQLVNRFDLNDHVVRTTSEALQDSDQAGQVRFQGCHAFLSDYEPVRYSLQDMLQELNGTRVRLEKQLEAKNSIRIRDRLKIYVVTSLCGGTGSSMLLEICALLRELSKGMQVDLVLVCIAPSAFEKVLRHNSPEQWKRVQANAYATMQEINAFMEGFGPRYQVDFGPDELNRCTLEGGFAKQLIVVGRITADGRDLGSIEAVYDLVTTSLAAEIGTEISDAFEMDATNELTIQGSSVDPATGSSRILSTIGANTLCLDTQRTALYCSYTASVELLERTVVGQALNPSSSQQAVVAWVDRPTDKGAPSPSIGGIAETLRRSSVPNISGKLGSVYQGQQGRTRRHYRDAGYLAKVSELIAWLTNQAHPKFKEHLAKGENTLTKSLVESLTAAVAYRVATYGLAEGVVFTQGLGLRLKAIAAAEQKTADEELRKVTELSNQMKENQSRLSRKWFRHFTKSKSRQIQLVADIDSAFHLETSAAAHQAAVRINGQLTARATKLVDQMTVAIKQSETVRGKLMARRKEYQAGRRVNTMTSLAEIDIASSHTDRQLYTRFCPTLSKLGPDKPGERLRWYLDLCNEGNSLTRLQRGLESLIARRLDEVDVVEVLADQLADDETAPEARAKIRQAMLSTQPAWTANARNNSVQYADAYIAGVPESSSPSKRQMVIQEMMDAATSRINPDGQYRGTARHVIAGDRHKIYISRKTHGATWHYLPEVKAYQEAFESWKKAGGHPVHIFNKKIVAKMQPLLPMPKVPAEELAFALGLAYGWVAKRGPRFYWNVVEAADATVRCPLASHFPTVGSQFRADSTDVRKSPLEMLIESGKLCYDNSDAILETQFLGESWSEAVSTLADHPERAKRCLRLFNALRAIASDEHLAKDLNSYIDILRATANKTQGTTGLIERVSSIIARKVSELR